MSESDEDMRARRDAEATEATAVAQRLLIGRTIVDAAVLPHDDEHDCVNVLRLGLSDGTTVDVTGSYGGYTGYSCDEYVEYIGVAPTPDVEGET